VRQEVGHFTLKKGHNLWPVMDVAQSHNFALLLPGAGVPLLSRSSINSLKLSLDKALQLILHFFALISAQPL